MDRHPLRSQVRPAELRFISSLGNVDEYVPRKVLLSPERRRIASGARDDKGERISQDQQAAIVKALQALEWQQEAAFEERSILSEKMSEIATKLSDTKERLAAFEEDDQDLQERVKQLKREILTEREDREIQLFQIEEMRKENDAMKSRELVEIEGKKGLLRAKLRETEKALKQAIWGGSPSPSPSPLEPVHVETTLAVHKKTMPSSKRRVRNLDVYASLVDPSLKDVAEIRKRKIRLPLPRFATFERLQSKREARTMLGNNRSRSTPALLLPLPLTLHESSRGELCMRTAPPRSCQPRRRKPAGFVTVSRAALPYPEQNHTTKQER